MKKTAIILALMLLAPGCATKNYGRLQQLSSTEISQYTCREIEIEMAKVEAFRTNMAKEAKFDWKSAAALLGDWGIGNAIEKNGAEKSANARMEQLMMVRDQKNCAATSPQAAPVAAGVQN